LLSCGKNDREVYWREDTILNNVGVFNEEISTEALLISGRYKVVETDKALLELFWGIVVESGENDREYSREVLLDCRPEWER
jgi:hypothetical protein